MAGIAHVGVAMAAKRFAPKLSLGVLMLGSYFIDIIWGIFFLLGVEHYPTAGVVRTSPWSHGLFMAVFWSVIAGLIAARFFNSSRTGRFMGLLVFSHWVLDFIAKPMLYSFPTDAGLPLLFDGSPTVGLGLWSTKIGQNVGEYGILILGIVIYIYTRVSQRKKV